MVDIQTPVATCIKVELPPAHGQAIISADVFGAVLAVLSLMLSGYTHLVGTRTEKVNRRKDIHKEIFDRDLWPAVASALAELKDIRLSVEALSQTSVSATEFPNRLGDLQKQYSVAFEKLTSALAEIDESDHSSMSDWATISEKREEGIINAFSRASSNNNAEAIRGEALKILVAELTDLDNDLRKKVGGQYSLFA